MKFKVKDFKMISVILNGILQEISSGSRMEAGMDPETSSG